MKVTKATGSSDKTASKIDLEIDHLPADVQADIIEDVGTYLVEQTLLATSGAKSPVSGESFPALKRSYKQLKEAQGGAPEANLELTGEMNDALTFEAVDGGLEIGFFGDQAPKADGHNKFSGKENGAPQRRFLPGEGQNYKREIQSGVEQIIKEYSGNTFEKSDFSDVESKADLYDVLREVYTDMTNSQIRAAVALNGDLLDLLIDEDLLEFL